MNRIALLSALSLLLLGTAINSHATETLDKRYYGNRIIVKMKSVEGDGKSQPAQLTPDKMSAMAEGKRYILRKLRRTGLGADIVQLSDKPTPGELEDLAKTINARSDVEYAHVDYKRYPTAFADGTPTDPLFPRQWYLQGNDSNPGAANISGAWAQTNGTGIRTSVVDTGYSRHDDFDFNQPTKVYNSNDFISADADGSFSTAGDGDGFDDDGSDVGDRVSQSEKENNSVFSEDPACEASDMSSWHGAQVTGIINAQADNGGMSGIAPGSEVIMTRALGKCGGYISDIMDAALWSAGLPVPSVNLDGMSRSIADIINLSLGGGGDCTPTEGEAIWEIVDKRGVVVVTAAGNEANDANASAPGNCTGTINVAANTRLGGETDYTNTGSFVDISAPGGSAFAEGCDTDGNGFVDDQDDGGSAISRPECNTGIITPTFAIADLAADGDSTWIGKGTGSSTYNTIAQGTSFSAPIVSGLIALMLESNNLLSPADVYSILVGTAQPFPTEVSDAPRDCTTDRCGAGIVDGVAATEAARNGSFASHSFPIKSNIPGENSGGGSGDPFFGATGKGGGGSLGPLISVALLLMIGWRRSRD
ncbi:MAG: S8 family serine peptidase [Pseudomonadota bacterium]